MKGIRWVDVTEHAAEQSKEGPKAKTEKNEALRGLTYILIISKFLEDTDTS